MLDARAATLILLVAAWPTGPGPRALLRAVSAEPSLPPTALADAPGVPAARRVATVGELHRAITLRSVTVLVVASGSVDPNLADEVAAAAAAADSALDAGVLIAECAGDHGAGASDARAKAGSSSGGGGGGGGSGSGGSNDGDFAAADSICRALFGRDHDSAHEDGDDGRGARARGGAEAGAHHLGGPDGLHDRGPPRPRVVGWGDDLVRVDMGDTGAAAAGMGVTAGSLLRFAALLAREPVEDVSNAGALARLAQAAGGAAVAVQTVAAGGDAGVESGLALREVAASRRLSRFRFAALALEDGHDHAGAVVVLGCADAADVARCVGAGFDGATLPPCCQWRLPPAARAAVNATLLRSWLEERELPPAFALTVNRHNALRRSTVPLAVLYLDAPSVSDAGASAAVEAFVALARRMSFDEAGEDTASDRGSSSNPRRMHFAWVRRTPRRSGRNTDDGSSSSGGGGSGSSLPPSLEVWHASACERYVFDGDPTDPATRLAQAAFIAGVIDKSVGAVERCDMPWGLGSPLAHANHARHRRRHKRARGGGGSSGDNDANARALAVPVPVRPALPASVDVAVVGAGPAGVGVAVALRAAGVDDVVAFERGASAGASFRRWPPERRMVTPSFYSNLARAVDLNAVTPHSSPAFTEGAEHLCGRQFAAYLDRVVRAHELDVRTGAAVVAVFEATRRVGGVDVRGLNLTVALGERAAAGDASTAKTATTATRTVFARHVVWAGGEQSFPTLPADVAGANLGLHIANVPSWRAVAGRGGLRAVVVGGSDSGAELAAGLVARGASRVVVCDGDAPWSVPLHAPGALSQAVLEQLLAANGTGRLALVPHHATSVAREGAGCGGCQGGRRFVVACGEGGRFRTPLRPLFATGYTVQAPQVADLLPFAAGSPRLNGVDESVKTPGLFFAGPRRRRGGAGGDGNAVFEFRLRFPVIASAIAARLGVPPALTRDGLAHYARHNMASADDSWEGDAAGGAWDVGNADDDDNEVELEEEGWSVDVDGGYGGDHEYAHSVVNPHGGHSHSHDRGHHHHHSHDHHHHHHHHHH